MASPTFGDLVASFTMAAVTMSTLIWVSIWFGISSLLALAFYRLCLSPLAKFPGPKLAALTGAYEGYFDCLKDGGGRFYIEVNRMHDQYGEHENHERTKTMSQI